jgi:hypothetical protein
MPMSVPADVLNLIDSLSMALGTETNVHIFTIFKSKAMLLRG